jgi:hypothetical protein
MSRKQFISLMIFLNVLLLLNVLFLQKRKEHEAGIKLKDYMREARPKHAMQIKKYARTFIEKLKDGDGQSVIKPIASDLTPFQLAALNKKLERNILKDFVVECVLSSNEKEPDLWEAVCASSSDDKLRFQFCKCQEGIRLCNVF